MKMRYSAVAKRVFLMAGLMAVFSTGSAFAQNKAVDFKQGMPFSGGYIAGNTLYVAGQQGRERRQVGGRHQVGNNQHHRRDQESSGCGGLQND